MKYAKLQDMVNGWFIGAFSPVAYKTDACEVAVKCYKAGDKEDSHYHKIATEITLIVSGRVHMAGQEWGKDDIIIIYPGDVTDFEAITDCVNVVVKIPGALNDKFLSKI